MHHGLTKETIHKYYEKDNLINGIDINADGGKFASGIEFKKYVNMKFKNGLPPHNPNDIII